MGGGGGGDEGGGSKEGRVSGMRRTMRERNWELRGKERRALVREGRRKKLEGEQGTGREGRERREDDREREEEMNKKRLSYTMYVCTYAEFSLKVGTHYRLKVSTVITINTQYQNHVQMDTWG